VPEEDLDGLLAYNNGAKLLYDGRRFHATYARFAPNTNDTTSLDDRIFYACSYPVGSLNDPIRWNPIDVAVSFEQLDPDSVRQENRAPSITLDFAGGDTVAVIAWSCRPVDTAQAGMREIVTRRVRIIDPDGMGATEELGPLTTVAFGDGAHIRMFGTPVVSRLDGGVMVAWSDSGTGIRARFQKRPSGSWPTAQPQQSATVAVSAPLPGGYADAWLPSMPPFAQVGARDSNVAIVFAQLDPRGIGNSIWYRRLEHYQQPGGGPAIRLHRLQRLNLTPGLFGHPAIDQWQCWWNLAYEGVVWEDMTPGRHAIVYRPVATETEHPRGWDSIRQSYAWIPLTIRMAPIASEAASSSGPGWPTIASLNQVIDGARGSGGVGPRPGVVGVCVAPARDDEREHPGERLGSLARADGRGGSSCSRRRGGVCARSARVARCRGAGLPDRGGAESDGRTRGGAVLDSDGGEGDGTPDRRPGA